jgi:hypothetical protein
MKKYKQGLKNIKNYLVNEGLNVDEVTMWQGGFRHRGTDHGLEIIATVEINGVEERYFLPKYLVTNYDKEKLPFLKITKEDYN